MAITVRELWTLIHGMVLGAAFLLAFAGNLAGLTGLRPESVTAAGIQERLRCLNVGVWVMAAVAWLTVITGTYCLYPWYVARPPEGADLRLYPRSFLNADPNLAVWHTFGMEWKEHIAWIAPILATVVAYLVWRYGPQIARTRHLRAILIALFTLVFVTAGIAGLFGALVTKAAPLH